MKAVAMGNKYLVCFALGACLTVVSGTATDPTCTSPTCTSSQTCTWTCVNGTNASVLLKNPDISTCTADDVDCGLTGNHTGGKCKAKCLPAVAQPKCTPTCPSSKNCTWTCNNATNASAQIQNADLSTCTAEDAACGPTGSTTVGKCKAKCLGSAGGDTSKKNSANDVHGLTPLLLISAVITKFSLNL